MNAILILGGTGEGRELAGLLHDAGIEVITSLAGRVAQPRLPVGEVRIGGFGQYASGDGVTGLTNWLRDNNIQAVVDATHPFAATITHHSAEATRRAGVPLLRLRRPAWDPADFPGGDRWHHVASIEAAAQLVSQLTTTGGRDQILLTTGRQDASAFAGIDSASFLIRVVDAPTGPLPPRHEILRSRGPYDADSERQLLTDHHIDVLVTKNSGGALTRAKLDVAGQLDIDIVVVDRPTEPQMKFVVDTATDAFTWCFRNVD
ncbi:cobalt-precorrin-6A reductase [Gordonia sp. (in: high G+C Gram-positive bacteria)]|uniref:cobalt-precorrin-6A reductase n=1 Tax=Gordonia sp. (in: high G+C Gram-positive bacteria) TaxID=84139 RepID=UPI001DB79615|nr:cobalt-precorrin-6A reductase [Gordonia sp. (in: high G+C Gram-positive bacteria)]MCB1294100.1 cobalt-precorrin-6A reductase [Gordonia sp. (in: high G+C Gram-positive bacteria)]HMS76776.1 cobalt-precorrin-6A reductase [Gordonia sp. (in: high G+C Gram-positive bacteria)]HQV19175.1 cobalt-precorrin-6A reductase [Gordonia sp. (in: high G+C Gram-positive bacteria)]